MVDESIEFMNARVCDRKQDWSRVIEEHREKVIKKNKKMLLEFYLGNVLTIMHTQFLHKQLHESTRDKKSREEQSILDYSIVNKKKKKNWIEHARIRRSFAWGLVTNY